MNPAYIFRLCLILLPLLNRADGAEFLGRIVDFDTSQAIAARVYIRTPDDKWLHVETAAEQGTAMPYREQWVPIPGSVDKHTTVSAHPFRIDLMPGAYEFTIERGKEYLPLTTTLQMEEAAVLKTFRLKRWIDMSRRGWFSGETHVHRRLEELPNVMLAEDLNVAFPVAFWTVNAYVAPGLEPSTLRRQGPSPFGSRRDQGYERIAVNPTHVIFPRNTEYEVFFVDGKRHTLGAMFILNHRTIYTGGMPPVASIAEQAHREGALLDLDKHNWPWAMMLIPIAKVDLFELANNSLWRTRFGFRRTSTEVPDYMKIESNEGGLTEWGWIRYGLENYYTLLNCGFRLSPTAGTASGVHPVPLGFGRVYVHVGDQFDADRWLSGLGSGRSFVTTGPMLFAKLQNQRPGHTFEQPNSNAKLYDLQVESVSSRKVERVEIIVNGRLHATLKPNKGDEGSASRQFVFRREVSISISESSWIAVRSIERQSDGRTRFAHTAPFHIDVAGKPISPRQEEIDFLIRRVQTEIDRNQDVLPEEAMREFRRALEIYKEIGQRAKSK